MRKVNIDSDRETFDDMLAHIDSSHYFCADQFKRLRQLLLKDLPAETLANMTDEDVVKAIDGRYLCLMTWGTHSIVIPRSKIDDLFALLKVV